MVFDFAIWAAGAVTVPVYETSPVDQIRWILSDSGAVAVFTGNAHLAAAVQQPPCGGAEARPPRGCHRRANPDCLIAASYLAIGCAAALLGGWRFTWRDLRNS